ncbi:translocation/assembly module TamB domain-containing protein [Sphingobacterium hungaricum]
MDIGYVNITFPKKLVLENIYFEDQSKDTLIAGEKLLVDINMFKLLKNTVEINEIELEGITAKINRKLPDGAFNFDYIVKAFASQEESAPTADSSSALTFDIKDVLLERIRFVYSDEVIGTSADINLKHFDTRIKKFDLTNNMAFDLPKVNIDGLSAVVKQWAPATEATTPTAEDFGITDKSVETASLLPDIGMETLNLKNIFVRYEDASSAMKTKFDIKSLVADIEQFDLNKEIVRLNNLALDGSDSEILFGKLVKKAEPATASDTTSTSSVNWIVSANKVAINKTNLWFKDDNQARMKGFDYGNIKITDFLGNLQDLYYSSDSISGSLKNLTAKDHSGLLIKKLQADFVYTNTGAVIENLLAETPKSIIKDYIKVSYPSLDVLSTKPELVKVEANIAKSYIDMSDINYFAPDLQAMDVMKPLMNKRFYVDSKISGSLNDLNIPRFEFKTLQNTHIIATAKIKGLPDPDKLNIDLNLKKMVTSKRDLDQLIAKSMLPESIQLPNSISLAGTFKGGLSGFNADLKLVTEKGNAVVNGNLNMGARDTTYDAFVQISDFNLGHLLNQDSVLGIISAEANVKGEGLNPKTMVADVQGKINRLDALGYQYHDINLDLTASNGDIAGTINSPDPNIDFDLELSANMKEQYPKVNMELMIDSVNLKNLKLMDDEFRYHGKINADFETADLNFLNGSIVVSNSSIAFNDERYSLDTVSLVATADTSKNTIVLDSEFLNAHLVGKYTLTELPMAIEDIIHMYYNPSGTALEAKTYSPQQFEFSARVNHSRFIRNFLPELEQMQDITLDGTFNSADKSIMAKLLAPKVIYSGTEIENVGLDIITVDSTLYYSSLIKRIKVSNIELLNTVISGSVIENHVDFGLWIKDKLGKDNYYLGADMRVADNNYILSLKEDGLMLNYDTWNIVPDNQISFGTNGIRANNFKLTHDGQELMIQSQDSTANSPIDLIFNNFRIETLTEMLNSETLKLGGGINGNATISRLDASPVFVSDLTIDKFFFGTDTIGNVAIKVNNETENTFSADVRITENGNDVNLIGQFISVPGEDARIDATLDLKPMRLKTIEAFSLGNLQNSDGDITGSLKITGTTSAPRINGSLLFNNGRLNVSMLNADFLMNNQSIYFNDQGIQFRQFEIKDPRGNLAKLNGTIKTTTYTDFAFGLNLTTDNFAVVNSTREDNDLFFGKMYVTSNLRIGGDLNKPSIDGNVTANENTDFVFIVPNENPGVAQRDGVVVFVDKSDTLSNNVFAKLDSMTTASEALSGFDIALNLTTNREAKFKVILDEGTNNALNIQGIAEINTTIDASQKITMSGTFTVEKGDFSFTFSGVTKDFGFQKGSTITWNGDPLDARLDITALYSGKFATLELVQNQIGAESQNLYKQRIPFDVKLMLSGELFKPEITFDIDLDENSALVSQDVVSKVNIALSALREDPAELNKQVFSLIVLGRFMAANPFESLSGGAGAEGIVRGQISSFLTSQLNNLASNLVKGVELDFNLNSEQDYLTGTAQNRTDLNVGISKMLFDDRLKITIGSNFEVEGNARPGEQTNNIAGDISLDYQLSQDGRYIARVYRKNQYQATLMGQFVETGLGFVVNMNYDKFKELFMNSKALEQYYNVDSKQFRRRFDTERMETDSVYRDSIREVIRDSLMIHSPEYRKRLEERKKEELKQQQQDSTTNNPSPSTTDRDTSNKAIRNEEQERRENES